MSVEPWLTPKLRPHWSVIGRIFSSAHFALDPGRDAFSRGAFARQNSIYAKPTIFFEGAHLVIPPAEQLTFLVMDSKGVVQAQAAQVTKGFAFTIRRHDCPAPKIGVVYIFVFGSDIEIAAHDEVRRCFFRKAFPEPAIPMQFIFVCW